ncbi:cobalamin-dependent protein [Bacteroidales bacterium OttesenSCG-928-C03]|nr:cobalamin-dependent protein [Bacteroidales bacterium OttesenSCG-928-C03]MDL2325887.1 cobalamin-dependent protein [Bacteroidales bacterium OttesenSCG-928-A14]
MKILFVRPDIPKETIGLQHVMIVEPLELEILATLVENKHQVEIIDLILEKHSISFFIEKHKPEVVCLTGYITHNNILKELCKEIKQINSNITTIVGGVHIEKIPESVDSEFIDYRVVRNAVDIFPKLINYLENGNSFPSGVLRMHEALDENTLPYYKFDTPIPNRTLTEKYRKHYFYVFHDKVALLKTSFGCPFPCNFCFCRKITGENYVEIDMNEVITELKTINEKEIYIIDDNFLVSEKRVQTFLQLLKTHNINKKYLIYGRADFIAQHPDIIRDFRKQGLRTIIVGFESFNDNELSSLNKKTIAETNEKAMRVLNDNNVDCYASVIAMPEWDKEDFARATKKMLELGIKFLNIQPLTPLEKTDFEFDDNRLIIPRTEYEKWDLAHIVIKPEKLTVHEYYKEILKMYERILFNPRNLIRHLKHPIRMQFKLFSGAFRVRKQYQNKILCQK